MSKQSKIHGFFKRKNAQSDASTSVPPPLPNSGTEASTPAPENPHPLKSARIDSNDNENYEIDTTSLERDPGKRKQIWEYPINKQDAVRRAYIKLGPNQPLLNKYPQSGQNNHLRSFQPTWYALFPSWLEYSEEKDAAFCLPCYLFYKPSGHQGHKAFTVNGFHNWASRNFFFIHLILAPLICNLWLRPCSPGTKTPSLVARLMGLDLLPESHSPSSTSSLTPNPRSISKPHLNLHPLRPSRQPLQNTKDFKAAGTRSLPETPRISSGRRSDVDHHHRLSLQINKENIAVGEELEFSRLSSFKRKELLKSIIGDHESGRSPSHYARQIVKQVKETVSRKMGLVDVTNTTRNDRDLLNHQLKLKKATQDANPGKPSTPSSCSPRLRLSEAKTIKPRTTNTIATTTSTTCKDQIQVLPPKPNNVKVQAKPKPQPLQEQKPPQAISIQKSRRIVDDGFSPAKLKKQEEAFVRPSTAPTRAQQQCKKTQLISNNLLNLNNVPTLLPIKKDPSPPATKLPQKQLSSSTSQQLQSQYKQDQASSSSLVLAARGKNYDVVPNGLAAARTTGGAGVVVGISADVLQYVTRILCRTGIDKDTQVSFTNWFSPSHPLDPSIFYHLEDSFTAFTTTHPSQLGLRCNRKLVFHVVDEILVEILRPYLNLKPWVSSTSATKFGYKGSKLIDIVCYKIQSFPGADCRVLEDIDELIDEDLPDSKVQSVMALAFEEEGEGVMREMEEDILDTLVHETAMCLWF